MAILAQIHYKLLYRQAKFPRILSQNGQNDNEGHGQWPLFLIPAESIPRCMFGANLVILAQIFDDLSHGPPEFPRIQSQNGQNDIEGQGQWPFFSKPAEGIPWCIVGANFMIPAQIYDKLSCGQGKVDGWTDAGHDNTPMAWKSKGWKHTIM